MGSLGLCLMVVTVSPKTSFFMMPLRFWEFGLGIVAARFAVEGVARTAAGLAGTAAILLCMMLPVDGEALSIVRGHPGLAALAISLATAAVLYCGIEERLLATLPGRILRRIGDMSYSIYLVHFPIIVLWFYTPFGGTHLGDGSVRSVATILPLIAVAGAAAYYGLERRGARLVTKVSVPAAMAGAALLGLLLPAPQMQRFSPYQQAVFSAWTDRSAYRCGISFRLTNPVAQFCVYRPKGAIRETVMLIGDSHADSIKESFKRAAFDQRLAVAFAVSNEPLLSAGLGPDWMVAQARALGVRRVFLHYALDNQRLVPLEKARQANAAAGIETILILPVPEARRHIPQMMYSASVAGRRAADLDRADYERRLGPIRAYLSEPRAMLRTVELGSALCSSIRCAIADASGHPYYFDGGHLTLLGARRLEPVFGRALNGTNPLPDVQSRMEGPR
jgi:hypothetical protein